MTLTSHAIVGAAIAQLVSTNPIIGFFAAFLSHFVADAVTHGHYPIHSHTHHPKNPLKEDMIIDKRFLFDLVKIGFDFCLGIALVVFFFHPFGSPRFSTILAGVIGGVLPDALQFAYFKIRREPLISLQKFHIWIHARTNYNHELGKAVFVEGTAIIFAVLTLKALLPF